MFGRGSEIWRDDRRKRCKVLIIAGLVSAEGIQKMEKLHSLIDIIYCLMSGEPAGTHEPHARPYSEGILIVGINLSVVKHHCRINHVAWGHII